MIKDRHVPTDRLELYPIDVSLATRKRIERQAEKWWTSYMADL